MAIALSGSSDGNNIAGPSSQILSENKKGSGGEMVGGCSVCCDDQGTERNLLVYCDGCEVAVHQACYGIISVPSGNWFCRKCESGDSQNKIKCELCPSKDGALKKTETGAWAHVVCALYIPEVRFGNNNTMEPIEIKHIQADRYNKTCYLCEEGGNSTTASYGAVMNCHKQGCKQAFHVTCAQSAGLLCEEGGQGSEHVNYCGYCKHHFRKMKAGNRKAGGSYLNNSNSSYADSASDSSQDNDSRCNKTEQDKSSTNRTTNNKLPTLPTNLSMNDVLASDSNTTLVPSTITASKTSSASNSDPISLTIPINSTSSSGNKASVSSSNSAANTPQKKKRAPKSSQPNSTSSPSTLLATAGSLPNSLAAQPTTASSAASASQFETSSPQADIYKWSGKEATVNNKSGSSSKKKPATALNTQSSTLPGSAKPPTSTTQTLSMTNYNLQKIGSPNLSLSTSPSLASPSNSTKSTSNSSTSSTANASSSSSSNSPSPALLSPNISSSRGSTAATATTRLESPLASNSKKGNNLHNRAPTESIPSNTLQIGQNSLQTRISFGNSAKSDSKKIPTTSSSLLSTAVPHEQPAASTAPASLSTNGNQVATTDITPATTLANFANLGKSSIVGSAKDSSTSFTGPSGTTVNSNTQPTAPPLIVSVPTASNSPTAKSTGRAKPAAKTTRKKSAEINEAPKPEPKTKTTRAKKAASTATSTTNNNIETSAPKPDNKRGKAKAASKPAVSATVEPLEGPATKSTSSPNKRKSRSASNETSSTPSPVKRPRKKKAAPNASQSSDQQASNSNPPPHTNHQLGAPGAASSTLGTGPLMINTPMVNNRLLQGLSSAEGHADSGSRYFSPMASPYASFDHMNASSLSRASLSRLFTSSSADSNQAGSSDDPGKAFEELRENTWSLLSKCVLEQAAQFDIPSLIGTLYTLRSENEKLVNKVRDLTMRRDQMIATNARLDLSGPMLTQHLNNTSPNFSSVASGLANSPKSLPTTSPGSAINKQPLVSVGSYNHVQPGSLGPPGYLDRSSPLVSQTHSGMNNIKSSALSTPSPPIGALMAHSTSNRAGLITVNPPYMPNVFPQMNSLAQLGTNPQGSSYYPRQ